MFGEVSSESDEENGDNNNESGYRSDDSVKNARGGAHGNCEEDEDEFMIVLQAIRERKKIEAETGGSVIKGKLSQTGWKLKQNFLHKNNSLIEDKDRIDVFNGPLIQAEKKIGEHGEESGREDEVIILEYK